MMINKTKFSLSFIQYCKLLAYLKKTTAKTKTTPD